MSQRRILLRMKHNLSGKRFGRLEAIQIVGQAINNRAYLWLCRCDCGNEIVTRSHNLVHGDSKSCGCLHKEITSRMSRKHGMCGTRTYKAWDAMIQRCENKNNHQYKNYGARGIKVCDRWCKFENFYADMGEAPAGLTLDRTDNDGDNNPSNCRWVTMKQQLRNTRKNRNITCNGKTMCVSAWSEELGIHKNTITNRLDRAGLPVEQALGLVGG